MHDCCEDYRDISEASITDRSALATPSTSFEVVIRVRRDKDPSTTSASHPRPLPSVIRHRLKTHGKRREVPLSVTIVGRVSSKLTRAQSARGTSVCATVRQPMATTSCGWIRMTGNLRGVNAESRDNDCSYYGQRSRSLSGISCM